MNDTLLTARDGAVLTLTLNRPAAYNSFTRPMAAALKRPSMRPLRMRASVVWC